MVSYTSLLETEQFTFLVGPDRKRLNIHPGVLEHHSEPIHALIRNGQMRESNEKVAVLEDIDVDTFSLFAEYCYTGNYRAEPRYKPLSEAVKKRKRGLELRSDTSDPIDYCSCSSRSTRDVAEHIFETAQCGSCSKQVRYVLGVAAPSTLWTTFANMQFGTFGMDHDRLRSILRYRIPRDAISAKVSQHAKLYVMADRYLVSTLKDLTLHKLHRDLLEYIIWSKSDVQEITKLLRVAYDHTSAGSPLRDLVLNFAAAKAQVLVKEEVFKAFLGEGGEAVIDFTCKVTDRLGLNL